MKYYGQDEYLMLSVKYLMLSVKYLNKGRIIPNNNFQTLRTVRDTLSRSKTRICAIFSFRILALKILDISRHNSDMYFRFVKTKIFKSKVQVPFQFKLKLTQKLPLQIRMVDRFSQFLPSLPGSRHSLPS